MIISYSDLILLGEPPDKNIEILVNKYGAGMIELMMDGVCWWEDPSFWKDAIARKMEETGIKVSLHPPTMSMDLSCDSIELRLFGVGEHLKAIELAEELQAEHVVIHPGFCCENLENRSAALERALDSMELLLKASRQAGIKLAVENIGSRQYADYTLDEYCRFLQYFNPKEVVSLIDIGHAFLNRWSFPDLITKLGNRLYSLHLHDNNGLKDQHLPIGQGELPWSEIWSCLLDTPELKYLILEYNPDTPLPELLTGKAVLEKAFAK